uniref:Mitochondrial import inner membrane translocase subunit n=1 Tax=Talaromyces marneffei PM1 TaxID=1077442 RepID=A0A093VKK9_TALMA
MEGLNASEQRELAARMERKQMKEFMQMYSRLVQRCFDDCVNDFTTKSLISRKKVVSFAVSTNTSRVPPDWESASKNRMPR